MSRERAIALSKTALADIFAGRPVRLQNGAQVLTFFLAPEVTLADLEALMQDNAVFLQASRSGSAPAPLIGGELIVMAPSTPEADVEEVRTGAEQRTQIRHEKIRDERDTWIVKPMMVKVADAES